MIVCDDGLQHYRLARDIEIEVVDAQRRYGNGRMIPAGPLREPVSRASECDFRWSTSARPMRKPQRRPVALGQCRWRCTSTVHSRWPVGRARPLAYFKGQRVHAVAGIAHPHRFFDMLRARGIGVVPHAFADHHAYQPQTCPSVASCRY